MENYIETLTELGKTPLRLGKLCVLPFSGRVMGLYPREGLNVLWTHPALDLAASARTLLTGGGWTNLGGDRTWVSPEVELFIPDMARPMESYKVPSALDPADYRVVSQGASTAELETSVAVDFYRSGCRGELSLRKRVTELGAPDFPLPAGVSAAGYELACTLSAAGSLPESLRPAIWNLLQVPGGGEIVVPLKGPDAPLGFFGRQQYRQVGERIHASVPVASSGYKFGVLADHCRGVMLYLNFAAPQPYMILRRFSVGSRDQYFDVPFNAVQQRGFVQQVYIDDGTHGGFGEMEHHSTAMVPDQCSNVTDTCTTWAFAGSAEQLGLLAETFLRG